MSGHSKWHNIKLKKGKVDAQRGALFTKLSKEIILAAKGGSPDPEANYRLKMAVEKAREFNMPQDNIKRAIARGSGRRRERDRGDSLRGLRPARLRGRRRCRDRQPQPHGRRIALSVSAARRHARRDRAASAWMFDPVGIIEVDPRESPKTRSPRARWSTASTTSSTMRTAVRSIPNRRCSRACATHCARPACKSPTPISACAPRRSSSSPERELAAALAFLDALEEHEDVQRVFSNLRRDDAALEALV